MNKATFGTFEDISSIVSDGIPEGLTLEYKGSDVISRKSVNSICKSVTAFANSTGGQFIVGIEEKDDGALRLDGGASGPSKSDWIHKVINTSTFPSVEQVDIVEINEKSGTYYVISIPASPLAPHQSADKRYYKRRGSHSEPMEHYEVEDVRNRPKTSQNPLQIDLFNKEAVAFLHLKNTHSSVSVRNVICDVTSNVEFQNDNVSSLRERGLREMHPQVESYFILDSIGIMFGKNPEAEISVKTSYEFQGKTIGDSKTYYLADLAETVIMQPPVIESLKKIDETISQLSRKLDNLGRIIEPLSNIADGTGLRVSHRTLMALKECDQLFDPHEFDYKGYQILLDVPVNEALSLHRIFGTFGTPEQKKKDYAELSAELRERFEKRFRFDFE